MGTRGSVGEHTGRKGKKSSSDKLKQPQRGLGVAQLEKMRMNNQMGLCQSASFHSTFNLDRKEDTLNRGQVYVSSAPVLSSSAAYGYFPNNIVGMGDHENSEGFRYYDFQSETATRRTYNNTLQYQPSSSSDKVATCSQLPLERLPRHQGKDSINLNSESIDSEDMRDIDLNLKLWI